MIAGRMFPLLGGFLLLNRQNNNERLQLNFEKHKNTVLKTLGLHLNLSLSEIVLFVLNLALERLTDYDGTCTVGPRGIVLTMVSKASQGYPM